MALRSGEIRGRAPSRRLRARGGALAALMLRTPKLTGRGEGRAVTHPAAQRSAMPHPRPFGTWERPLTLGQLGRQPTQTRTEPRTPSLWPRTSRSRWPRRRVARCRSPRAGAVLGHPQPHPHSTHQRPGRPSGASRPRSGGGGDRRGRHDRHPPARPGPRRRPSRPAPRSCSSAARSSFPRSKPGGCSQR